MRRALTLAVLRTLVLVVLAASAALLYDYTQPLPAFCEAGAGCEAVRASSFAYILGIPQPAIGLLAYVVVFAATLTRHETRCKYLPPMAIIGGVLGIAFLIIQGGIIKQFCALCVVVDSCSIAVAVLAWVIRNAEGHDGAVPRFVWASSAAIAIVVPLVFGASQPEPPAPPAVARFWVPGKVTIVEMSDFQCPFCRILHPALKQTIEAYGDRVKFVRLSVPLKSHPQARVAAKAYACAKLVGRGEEMAHELFEAKDLSEPSIRDASKRAGLDQAEFDSCFSGDRGQEAMMKDVQLAREITFKGLPTLWIGDRQVVGARSAEELSTLIDEQLAGGAQPVRQLPHGWMWTLLGLVFVALVAATALRKPNDA